MLGVDPRLCSARRGVCFSNFDGASPCFVDAVILAASFGRLPGLEIRLLVGRAARYVEPEQRCVPAWSSGRSSTGPRSLRCVPRALRFKSSEGLCGVQIRFRAVRPVLTLGRFFAPGRGVLCFLHTRLVACYHGAEVSVCAAR